MPTRDLMSQQVQFAPMAFSRGNALHSTPTSRRRRGAAILVVAVMALVGGLVFSAVQAEGREVSRVEANDGGAWVVNREYAAVAHQNRATGELSTFVRLTDAPTADIYQASGVVVVHDPATNQLFEVDARSSGPDQAPTQLPEFAEVIAVDGAVIVFRPSPLAVWRVEAATLTGLSSFDGIEPLISGTGPGMVTASNDGTIVAVDSDSGLLYRYHPTTGLAAGVDLEIEGAVIDVTLIGSSAVVLTSDGEIRVVGPTVIEHQLRWDTFAPGTEPPVLLQLASVTVSSTNLEPASSFGAVTATGELLEITLGVEGPAVIQRGQIPGTSPVRPIMHNGCIYGVVVQPPTFGAACDDFYTQPLDGTGSQLRLRLVNGWIWVNDVENGRTFATNEDLQLEELDDWALVIDTNREEDEEDEPDGADLPAGDDAIIIEDPDAEGDVRDTDDFDPGEANEPPIAVDDFGQTRVDTTTVIEVLANDSDPNNDVITVVDVEMLQGDAFVTVTPSSLETQVTPGAGFTGLIEYRYSISDGRSAPVSAIVQIDVLADDNNRAPVAVTDIIATAPGEPATIDVLRNDSDPDGDAILLAAISGQGGTLRWDPAGQITFTPDSTTDTGWIELPYVVADTRGAETEGRVRVEIRDQQANQEPDARNDHATTVVGRPVAIDLLANDSDPDGDPLIVGSRPQLVEPATATVETSTSADGEFVFSADEPGTYIFTYTVNDSAPDGSESDTARIRVDVLPNEENFPPIAVRDDVVIPVGDTRTVYVLDNDGDPDGDVIAIVNWQVSAGVLVSEFSDGTGHVGFEVTLTQSAGPSPTMTYSISDGVNPPVSAPVQIAVASRSPQNQPPFATDDVREVRAGQTIDIFVLENDFDPEGEALRIVDVGRSDVASISVAPDSASLVVSIPDEAVSSFTVPYEIEDPAGNRAAAVLRMQLINPSAANRAPIARTDTARTRFGQPVAISVLSNDFDPDADSIALDGIVEQPARGTARQGLDGTIVYTPDSDFRGTDVFTYSIVDAAGDQAHGEVFVGVMDESAQNLPPIANDDSYELLSAEASPLAVLVNDRDPEGDPLRVVDVTAPSLGTVTLDGITVIYQPPLSMAEAGIDTFTYVIADSAGNRADATVTVTLGAYELEDELEDQLDEPIIDEPDVTPTPAPSPTPEPEAALAEATTTPTPTPTPTPSPTPVPQDQNAEPVARDDIPPAARAGTSIVVDALANDFDPDGESDRLRIVSVGEGATTDGLQVFVDVGSVATQISYTITDEPGAEAQAVIFIAVAENQAPSVEPLVAATSFETPIALELGSQATDADDDALFFVCCDSARGGAVEVVAAAQGQLSVIFTPDTDFVGEAGFAYTVDDQQGHRVAGSVTVAVGAPGNRAPEVLGESIDLPQRSTVSVNLTRLSSDPDDDLLDYQVLQSPTSNVQVRILGDVAEVIAGEVLSAGETDFFTYEVSDGVLVTEGRVDFVIVEGENRAPIVTDTVLTVAAASGDSVDLRDLTTELDLNDSVEWTLDSAPEALDVELSGSFVTISAPSSASGTNEDIGFTATDTRGGSASGVITVEVVDTTAPVPVAVDDVAPRSQPGGLVQIDVLENDTDPLLEGLKIVSITTPSFGNAAIRAGLVEFVAGDGEVGTATLNYTMSDSADRESTASITVLVVSEPDAPAPPGAVAASRQVTLAWETPQLNGSELLGYRITPNVGAAVDVGVQNSYVWSDLTNGIAYTFTVTALSDLGPSAASGPSPEVTPNQVPESPAVRQVTFEDGSLFVEWDEPANLGTDIDDYEIRLGGPITGVQSTGGEEFFRWEPLVNGDSYTFELRAHNSAGWSLWGPSSVPEHPAAAPDAPTIGTTVRTQESGALSVNWTRPAADNGDPIIEYLVESSAGSAAVPVAGANAESVEWSNLANGVEVSFRVQARNRAGLSDWSAWSVPVFPCGRPDAPVISNAVRGDTQATISWGEVSPPGCEVTSYWVSAVDSGVEFNAGTNLSRVYAGLTNGTQYTFTVQAENEQGRSVLSAASAPVIPAGPPIFCPTSGSIAAIPTAPGAIRVDWGAAIANGDPAGITDYEVRTNSGSWVSLGSNTPSYLASGLSNNTTYSFEVRAFNTVDVSPTVCGSVSARTWALPTALAAATSYDQSNNEVTYTLTGAVSDDTPLTSITFEPQRDGAPISAPAVPFNPFVQGYVHTITPGQDEDGAYGAVMSVCNAVGCVDSTAPTVDVVTPKPPDQVLLSELVVRDHILTQAPANTQLLGMSLSAKVTQPEPGRPGVISYMYEVERQSDLDPTWTPTKSGEESFSASAGFPWTLLGQDVGTRIDPLYGYSNSADGWNQGFAHRWRVRVKAINDVGEADWSDWIEAEASMPSPLVRIHSVFEYRCQFSDDPPDANQCHYIDAEIYGFAPNTEVRFFGGTGSPNPGGFWRTRSGDPESTFIPPYCTGSMFTDEFGRIQPGNGNRTDGIGEPYTYFCTSAGGADVRLEYEGVFSPWMTGVP